MRRFSKKAYRTNLFTRTFYTAWKQQSGHTITYRQWLDYWMAMRDEFCEQLIDSTAGVDLPFFLGNVSIKLLDNEFKCAADFPKAVLHVPGEGRQLRPFIQSEVGKRPKIVWKKHKLFMGIPALMGMSFSATITKRVSQAIQGRLSHYEKAQKYGKKKSKCEEIPLKGLFD